MTITSTRRRRTRRYCSSSRLIGHGRNEQVIRDLPTHGKRLAIYVDTRRWRCQDCGKTFMETLPAVNAKREMTDRLVKWIGQQSLKRTFASIADDTGLDEKTIRNIFRDYVNELEAQLRCPLRFAAGSSRVRSTRDGDRTDEEAIQRGTDLWVPA
mgnify:CR=1 FL=1